MSTLGIILCVFLFLLLIGAMPRWNYSRNWGNAPMGIVGIVLIILVILILTGNLRI